MILKDIIKESIFATIATVKEYECIDKSGMFIEHNKEVIKEFPVKIICLNKTDECKDYIVEEYKNQWLSIFPDMIILYMDINRKHMFGTIDLEEHILKHIKSNYPDFKYLWKSMDDVLINKNILELEVEESDFYYLPGFSYESILKANGKEHLYNIYENFESGLWTPQTTFFIIRCDNIDNLYGDDVDTKYAVYMDIKKNRNSQIKPWEIPFDIKFDCETHLGRTTKDMKKYCLTKSIFRKLLDFNDINPIGDPSHKNLYLSEIGICHYHFYNEPVFMID